LTGSDLEERVPLDGGLPLSGLEPLANHGIAEAGPWLDEMDDRGRDGNRRKCSFWHIPAGHASGDGHQNQSGSNCLEPDPLPCREGPGDGGGDADRFSEVAVPPLAGLT
jgi:hypothetical protein